MDGFPVMAMVEQDPTLIAFHKRTTKHQGPLIKQQVIKNRKCEGPMRLVSWIFGLSLAFKWAWFFGFSY